MNSNIIKENQQIESIEFESLKKTLFGLKIKVVGRTKPILSDNDLIVKNILKYYGKEKYLKTNNISDDTLDELFNKICSEPILEEQPLNQDEDLFNDLEKYFSITTDIDNKPIDIINSVYDLISSDFLILHKQINELPKIKENENKRDELTKRFSSITQVLTNLIKFKLR